MDTTGLEQQTGRQLLKEEEMDRVLKTGPKRSQVSVLDEVAAIRELQSGLLLTLDLTLFESNPHQSLINYFNMQPLQ